MNSNSTGYPHRAPPPEEALTTRTATARAGDGAHRSARSSSGPLTLTEVHQQHAGFVLHLVKRHVPSRDLPDLVQMSFMEIDRGLWAYDPARPIQPWIATVVLRTVQRHRRRVALRHRAESWFCMGPSDVVPSSEDRVEARDLLPHLLACLKERQLKIVLRHLRDEEPIDVISRDLGISADGGYKLLQTALAKLQDAERRFEAIERRQLAAAGPHRAQGARARRVAVREHGRQIGKVAAEIAIGDERQ